MPAELTYSIREAAKILGVAEQDLFATLRKAKALDSSNQPRQHAIRAGRLKARTSSYRHPVVGLRWYCTAQVTSTGMAWLQKLTQQKEPTA